MNYYERHLGDFVRDTAHLSMIEDGAYNRLLDRYYATESGIPEDQAHRVARARTKEERQAVDDVLNEFFTLKDGVWVKGRVEEEITKAQSKIKAAQENGKKGGRPKVNPEETQKKPTGLLLGSKAETQKKAHQTPDTRHQSEEIGGGGNPQQNAQEQNPQTAPPFDPNKPTAGQVCKALKDLGLSGVNPGHATLTMLLEVGATLEEFTGAGQDAIAKKKTSFSYILGIVKSRREEAKEAAENIATGSITNTKPWYITASGIEAKANELGITISKRDESFPDLQRKVYEAEGITPDMVRKANADFKGRA